MTDVKKKFDGISDRQYKLAEILVQSFVNKETGEERPYYEIWAVSILDNRMLKFKPADTSSFGAKLADYKKLEGTKVALKISAKMFDGKLLAVVDDIFPIL